MGLSFFTTSQRLRVLFSYYATLHLMSPDITVTVRLYATLRNHHTNPEISGPLAVTVPAGAVAADLVGALQLPPEQVHNIFIPRLRARRIREPVTGCPCIGLQPETNSKLV